MFHCGTFRASDKCILEIHTYSSLGLAAVKLIKGGVVWEGWDWALTPESWRWGWEGGETGTQWGALPQRLSSRGGTGRGWDWVLTLGRGGETGTQWGVELGGVGPGGCLASW